MTLTWLLAWWNLVFLVPLGLALVYLGIYTISGVTFGEGDADVDHDADLDADVDAHGHVEVEGDADVDADADSDVEAEAEAEADGDHDVDQDADHGSGGGRSSFAEALAWLGAGQVPLSTLLMVLLMFWGFIGFTANQFGREWAGIRGAPVALLSIPLALIGSAVATRSVARLVHRLLPNVRTDVRRRSALLGEVGDALFPIDERFGMAAVRDDRGNLYQVRCRIDSGHAAVGKGEKVLLVGYDARTNTFDVVADDGGVLARPAVRSRATR
jgi:membrane protein implicated in regulation of membrane protease activity